MRKALALLILASALGLGVARADVVTNRLALTLPTVGGDYYTWGNIINSDLQIIDAAVAALAAQNTFTSTVSFQNAVYFGSVGQSTITQQGVFQGSGAGLFALNASSVTSGTLPASVLSNAILLQASLQSGATFYVSSGTVQNINVTNLKFNDGTVQTTASGASNFIQNQNTLQAGATYYVSSGTVAGNLVVGSNLTAGLQITANNFNSTGSSIPNNGWTESAANQLGFYTGGTLALTLNAAQNAVFPGSVTVQGTGLSAPSVIVTGNQFKFSGDVQYRAPSLVWGSTFYMTVQTGQDGTAVDSPVLFPDGRIIISTSPTYQACYSSTTASLTGSGTPGILIGTATVDTWYAFYAVEVNSNSNWVLVATTYAPVAANFASLNSYLTANQWKYIGIGRYGDGGAVHQGFMNFTQTGFLFTFGNILTTNGNGSTPNVSGIELAGAGGVISSTYTYVSGMATGQIPPNIKIANYLILNDAGNTQYDQVQNSAGTRTLGGFAGASSAGLPIIFPIQAPTSLGIAQTRQSGTGKLDEVLYGYYDDALSGGNNPMF